MDTSPQRIAGMFDGIAHRYDRLNHLLSLGVDRGWRRRAVRELAKDSPRRILDVATGTGDMAVALVRGIDGSRVTGIDISQGMVGVARRKIERKGLEQRVEFVVGSAAGAVRGMRGAVEERQVPEEGMGVAGGQCSAAGAGVVGGPFDAAVVAFGVRNFHDPQAELRAIRGMLIPGGRIAVLEFSMPRNALVRSLYRFYFHGLLPRIGGWVSGDREAYSYLPRSVEQFPHGEAFLKLMAGAGFGNCREKRLTFGIATLYTGENPA